MSYLNSLISKWMPEESKRVAVDSHPRLSGIMDTINSTLAHGSPTRLPSNFYDAKGRDIIDKIGVEEWFSGYKENLEYRKLGIGSLLGDIVSRMVDNMATTGYDDQPEVRTNPSGLHTSRKKGIPINFALSGCHDSTLAAILSSLGAFDGEKWPPYTSHLAIELFRKDSLAAAENHDQHHIAGVYADGRVQQNVSASKSNLEGYVRIRYNDHPIIIPGCRIPGKHFEGDEAFCTLVTQQFVCHIDYKLNFYQDAFKAIVRKFVPENWKEACVSNLDEPAFKRKTEPAGY